MNEGSKPNDGQPKAGSLSWPNVHPDFDGHLEHPPERMTPEQRSAWEEEMKRLHEWARRIRIRNGIALPEDFTASDDDRDKANQ